MCLNRFFASNTDRGYFKFSGDKGVIRRSPEVIFLLLLLEVRQDLEVIY